ncbi:hypothetical protein [Francisella salimarina]|uniref:hypothetical protein n=1 Tax=Francisella salimarina TaxID=2599927 RepID=UPI0037519BBD
MKHNLQKELFSKILKNIPEYEPMELISEIDYYGFSKYLADRLGIKKTYSRGINWKHGWIFASPKYIEQFVIDKSARVNFVANMQQQNFLESEGVKSIAVGLPFAYVNQYDIKTNKIKRIPRSLLIMPPHSLPHTDHSFNEEHYVDEILNLKDKFDIIVACVHRSCFDKKLWIKTFEKYNIPVIIGAYSADKNGLLRMSRIFRSFEYMTTNSIGSHVLYASYAGCKVSIYGKYIEYAKSDYFNDSFYKKYPNLLSHNLKYSSYEMVKKNYSFLFNTPYDATTNITWAANQIGEVYVRDVEYIAYIIKWKGLRKYPNILKHKFIDYIKLNKYLYNFIKWFYGV